LHQGQYWLINLNEYTMEAITIKDDIVSIKKKTAIIAFILAFFSLITNITAPLIWANNVINRMDGIEKTIRANEERSIKNTELVGENALVGTTLEFNLKRLMKDKFNMEYIEPPLRIIKKK